MSGMLQNSPALGDAGSRGLPGIRTAINTHRTDADRCRCPERAVGPGRADGWLMMLEPTAVGTALDFE